MVLSESKVADFRRYIQKICAAKDLSEDEAADAMVSILKGDVTPAQIGAFLTALHIKGETIDEITGCARIMREKAVKLSVSQRPVVDTCGTGGDACGTFNISTVAALAAAGAGARVAKHGNRSATGKCGSADILEQLGVKIDPSVKVVERCLEEAGIAFLFAQTFHPAMKFTAGPRREIGVPTILNILGPLTNPASAEAQLMGVFSPFMTEPMAQTLLNLGASHVMVVHGSDGLDEITVTGTTRISEGKNGRIRTYDFEPESVGIERADPGTIICKNGAECLAYTKSVLEGVPGPCQDIVALNAAAATVVAGLAGDLKEGLELAVDSLTSGKALAKLNQLKEVSNSDA